LCALLWAVLLLGNIANCLVKKLSELSK